MLGANSAGQVYLNINNTSASTGSGFKLLLPIPRQDRDLGDAFMDAAPGFTISMDQTPANEAGTETPSSDAFTVSYVTRSAPPLTAAATPQPKTRTRRMRC